MAMNKKIEGMDHAFELSLILISIISGILVSYVPTEAEIDLPPIIASIKRLAIVFVFPSILTILAWVLIYFIDNESLKMHLRSYAWSSIIFSGIIGVVEFYIICCPKTYRLGLDFVIVFVPVICGLVFPIIPFLLMWRILNRYKTAYSTISFFSYETKIRKFGRVLGKIVRYLPFIFSYVVFWLAFAWATLV